MFGEELKAARISAGMTQEELATKSGTTKQAISRYERSSREPNLKIAAVLAGALGVTLASLCGEEMEIPPDPEAKGEEDSAIYAAYKKAPENIQEAIRSLLGLK